MASRADRGRKRRYEGAVRLRLRRLSTRPPHRADRLCVPRLRVAAQGRPTGPPRSTAVPRQEGNPRTDGQIATHAQLFDLTGKSALVTGGTRGIGMMMARGLLQAGARVVISSRKADACAQAQDLLSEFGEVRAIPADP